MSVAVPLNADSIPNVYIVKGGQHQNEKEMNIYTLGKQCCAQYILSLHNKCGKAKEVGVGGWGGWGGAIYVV